MALVIHRSGLEDYKLQKEVVVTLEEVIIIGVPWKKRSPLIVLVTGDIREIEIDGR